ncbi:MAG: asparagine synthase (glutamine-hydrolyzing), partial [Myxococcales bacterium]|nr:asparagine synthase (glutamine-hydrolyzing) [Myxococcales bacterium]
MSKSLRHRGPDDSGIETIGPATLGFRRLSIIDLGGSHQPMSNEDESLWLLFNGEIYNYRSLREDLISRGHRFKTDGDGEVILHLYEEEGDDFVHRLNGMFGIALWDARHRRLVLVRDRLGIKPVYYHVSGKRLAFASETKALLSVPGLAADVDGEAVVGFMNYGSIPGRRTGLESVHRLLPGHLATWDETGFKERCYWDVSFCEKKRWEFGELVEATGDLLRDAVSLRTVSDVPLGAFLSGGVDSSLVASLLGELSSKPVESFSIGYGNEGAFMDETPFAAAVAERHGMNHHELILDSEDLLRDLDRVAWFLDEPCGDPAAFLTLALSEFTRKHVTVALSGVGADELFCGYRRYVGLRWQQRWLRLPSWLRNGVIRRAVEMLPEGRTSRLGDRVRLARKFVGSVDRDVRTSWALTTSYLPSHPGPLFTGDFAAASRGQYQAEAFADYWSRTENCQDAIDRVMYMDLRMYLPDQLLLLQDKM